MTQHPEFFKAQTNTGSVYIARAHIVAVDVPNKSALMGADKAKEPIVIHVVGRGEVRIFSAQNQQELFHWLSVPAAYVPAPPAHPTRPGAQ